MEKLLMQPTPLARFIPAVPGSIQSIQIHALPIAQGAAQHLAKQLIVKFVTLGVAAMLLAGGSAQAQPAAVVTAKPAQPAREWVTPAAGDVQKGAALYQSRCTACHAIDSNQTGPAHRGVMGRRIGSLPGYSYSAELARSRLRWTPQTLNVWLEDPEELVAGQRMGFQVEDAQERADLIAYLATLK